MPTAASPRDSARSVTISERPNSSRPSARSHHGYATLPPVKLPKDKFERSLMNSSREIRPTSAGNASVASARSSSSLLSTRLKASPYAVSLSARNSESKESTKDSRRSLTNATPIQPPRTPPGPEITITETRSPKEELDVSWDQLLETMMPHLNPGQGGESVEVLGHSVEPRLVLEEEQDTDINLNASLDLNALDLPVHDDESAIPDIRVQESGQGDAHSVESSAYCDHTLVGSIPEDVALPLDLSPLNAENDGATPRPKTPELEESVQADRLHVVDESAPLEPCSTPFDINEPVRQIVDESLTRALSGLIDSGESVRQMESPQASPIAIVPLNLSLSSTDIITREKPPQSARSVQVTARLGKHGSDNDDSNSVIKVERKKKSCWFSIFGCH